VIAAVPPVWPTARLGEALAAVARRRGGRRAVVVPAPPAELGRGPGGGAEVARWIGAAARSLGLEGAPVDARASATGLLVAAGRPMVLALPGAEFLVLAGERRRDGRVGVLGPDERVSFIPEAAVSRRLAGEGAEAGLRARVDAFCDELGLAAGARPAVAAVLGRARTESRPVQGWTLDPAEPRFWPRLREAGGLGLLARAVLGFALALALALAAWWVVGRGALEGRLEPGWLWAWVLILVSMVGAQAVASWAVGRLAVQLGGLTKERLLEGILALSPEEIRSRGVGQLLGSVLETEALEALARAGGPLAAAGLLQILAGGVVLGLGAAPLVHLAILVLWLAAVVAMGARYHRRLLDWADSRLALTHDLVESMVGHRTLVVQRPPVDPRAEEDAIGAYGRRGEALDGAAARLATLAPRGWLAVGLLGVAPGFVSGRAAPDALAISLGGVLLVYWALRKLVDAGPALAAAALAWRRTRPFFRAAAAARPESPPVVVTATDAAAAGGRGLLVAREVAFRYPSRSEPALRAASFAIRRGERVLLEGGSGSGKSTLGALLTGLREPSSGVLLLGGFDHHSLGPERWRERSGGVPQFHENHVLSTSLVFNLALGRGWPPRPDDWREVERVCEELGLGELLARMPAGLQQMVGDSGWQLSHGERSRVYVARSLLQDLDVRVLDESFAALDPETFELVLAAVLKRTRTLIVVAHT
jgi:ATP-binding cassette subfamily B protein